MKKDKIDNRLKGAIRTVRSRVVKLSEIGGKLVEEARLLPNVAFYDADGRKVEEAVYNHDGSLHSRRVFARDAKGTLTETAEFDSNGSLLNRTSYIHKPDGNRIEERIHSNNDTLIESRVYLCADKGTRKDSATYKADGSLVSRIVQFYDEKGREVEATIYHGSSEDSVSRSIRNSEKRVVIANEADEKQSPPTNHIDSHIAGKVELSYDDERNLTVISVYKSDGSLEVKKVIIKDDAGNTIEATDYTADGTLQSKEAYTRNFDSHGNWIEETRSKLNLETGTLRPVETKYRDITYY